VIPKCFLSVLNDSKAMLIDPENPVVQLCARGMELEGDPLKAAAVFRQAWQLAVSDADKCIAAHYIARHQDSIAEKLSWDALALHHALLVEDEQIAGFYPSLYLNIAKGYEDLQAFEKALAHYHQAERYAAHLPDDGYAHFIRGGISTGIARVSTATHPTKKATYGRI
jgi:tetratricopeptide (TPR) repeat protein